MLLVLFALAVTLVGGWRGVRSLIALALTLAVIVKVVVPLILAGWDPAWASAAVECRFALGQSWAINVKIVS